MQHTTETIANLIDKKLPGRLCAGRNRSKILNQIKRGLLPKPGRCDRVMLFNADELDILDTAVMLGYEIEEIKATVKLIHKERLSLNVDGDPKLNKLREIGKAQATRKEALANAA